MSPPDEIRETIDTDSTLISATASGSPDAFEELIKRYERPVLGTVYRYIGDAVASEDLAQEVFLKVWRNARHFKHKSSFSTWLYRIVVNQCLSYKEKLKRRVEFQLDESLPADENDIGEELDRTRKNKLVKKAVTGLPRRQRIALILSHFEGCSYKDVSEIMGISLSSVESLIFRAKQNLKRRLIPLKERGEL